MLISDLIKFYVPISKKTEVSRSHWSISLHPPPACQCDYTAMSIFHWKTLHFCDSSLLKNKFFCIFVHIDCTSYVVKLMFIAIFIMLCVTVMVLHICVRDTVYPTLLEKKNVQNLHLWVPQLITRAVPLKGELCTLSTP